MIKRIREVFPSKITQDKYIAMLEEKAFVEGIETEDGKSPYMPNFDIDMDKHNLFVFGKILKKELEQN